MRALSQLAAGFRLHWEGLRLLARERSLWRLAAVPLLLSLLALGGAVACIVVFAGEIFAFASGWLPALAADAWYEWLWVAPGRALLSVLGALLFLAIAGLALVVAFLLAGIAASPFLDALSLRVERLLQGTAAEPETGGLTGILREGARAAREEVSRTAFFVAVQAAILAVGLLVPGAQLVAPLAMTLFALLFLPLDYASYSLDRRRVPFREKRRWVASRVPLMAGFGSGAYLAFLVPGLNFLAMPLLVVTGTLLALRYPPAAAGPPPGVPTPGPGAAAGRATST